MAKRLNVALDFSANTTQAKAQIQELQQLLTKIAYGTDIKVNSGGISEASAAAKELAVHLNEAYDATTGNYDLSKLQASLTKSKTSITDLSKSLLSVEGIGQDAFIKLAQSIAGAEQPMVRLNAKLSDFLTTLKNTVKWQISSSMIHGVMGALQGAYGYAEDLNKSLNDIRIVTGYNIDYMEKYADKANKAAKALSSTTLDYTEASLIYFQQGLPEAEVEERTNATIKMANVTGDSAQVVSDQMTAIWNNFEDGSKSLEYYGDVMTELGARTASSTSEIAEALEKFASVGDTVGLSYEYAATAVATVIDKTRMSADVVGTAFKTVFARIQDLELGETLDDGTTLGTYSEALQAVGISIKDSNGQLKEMDTILNEMAGVWGELERDQKVALAESVAGVRQYTQLVALLDNWDAFQINLNYAYEAEGTLDEQQKIYEESWEAANNRLKASFQSLYQDIIDDKFFIKLIDFETALVDGVDDFIDRIGGVEPVILGIGSIILGMLSNKIQPAIDNMVNNVKIMFGGSDKVYGKLREDFNNNINGAVSSGNFTKEQEAQLRGAQNLNIAKQQLAQIEDQLTEKEKQLANISIVGLQNQSNEVIKLGKKYDELKEEHDNFISSVKDGTTDFDTSKVENIFENVLDNQDFDSQFKELYSEYNAQMLLAQEAYNMGDFDSGNKFRSEGFNFKVKIKNLEQQYADLVKLKEDINNEYTGKTVEAMLLGLISNNENDGKLNLQGENLFSGLISEVKKIKSEVSAENWDTSGLELVKDKISIIISSLPEAAFETKEFNAILQQLKNATPDTIADALERLNKMLKSAKPSADQLKQSLTQLGVAKKDIEAAGDDTKKLTKLLEDYTKKQREANEAAKGFKVEHKVSGVQTFTALASALGSLATTINTLKSAWNTINDPDVSGWEKVSSVFLSFSVLVPSVISMINQTKTAIEGTTAVINSLKAAKEADKIVTLASTDAINATTAAGKAANAIKVLQTITTKELTEEKRKELIADLKNKTGLDQETAAKIINIAVTKGLSAAAKELAISLGLVNTTLLATIGWLVAIAAIIGVVVGGIALFVNRSKAFETELEQSNEDLEFLKNNLNDVNSEVQEVTSSLDGLSSKYDSFKDLEYGTVEWREALYDINDEVQGLIDKYDDLKEGVDYYRDSLGLLHLTESGKTKIRDQVLEKQNKAQTAVRAQEGRDNELKRQAKIDEIVEDNQKVAIGTKQVAQYVKKQGTERLTGYKTETDYAALSEDSINKVVKVAIDDADFDWSEESLTQIAGLDERTAKLITTSSETRTALQDLTTETIKLRESYESEIFNELLARGLDLSKYDEEYRNGVGKAIASDVNEQEQAIITSRSQEGNKLTQDEILTLLENQGIAISSLSENWFEDFVNNNDTITAKKKDEETGYASDEEVTIDYDTLLKNFAAEEALQWGLEQQDNYYDEQKYSQQAFDTADKLKSSWDEQNFDENLIRESDNSSEGLDEVAKLRGYLTDNAESFSDIFGLSEDDFKDWLKDTSNLADNFGELQKAIDGDTGAINDLRDEMGSLGTHGQELVDNLADAFKDLDTETRNYLSRAYESDNFKIPDDAQSSIDNFVKQNADSLSDLAGISKDTFISMYNSADKKYAKKVTKLLNGVTKGNKKDLQKLAVETQKAFYTSSDNMNAAIDNVKNNWKDTFSQMPAFANTSLENVGDTITSLFDNILNQIDDLEEGMHITPEMDTNGIISSLNGLIAAFGLTKEQAQQMVASFGFSAEFESNPKKVTETEKAVVYSKNLDRHGHHTDPPKVVSRTYTSDIQVPTITALDYEGQKYGGELIDHSSGNSGAGTGEDEGGGGGSGDNYTPPDPKEYKDEIERYHVIKQKIEDLEEIMDRLAKAKDRAFGTSKLKLMDEEIDKYGEMIDLQNQYIAEIEDYLADDKALIASYGAVFDETGVITNYDQLMKNAIDKYNSSIGRNEDADDAAEEAYDDFIEALEQYEETNNLLQDELATLQDLKYELADVIFEKTEYKITIRIDVKDEELEYLEYLLSKIEDDAYAAAEAIALMGAQTQNALDKIAAYEDGLLDLLNNHGIKSIDELNSLSTEDLLGKEFTEDEIDLIREWNSAILEANQELLEMRDTIQESVLESFEQFSEDLEDQIDLFEHYESILSTVKDITNLLGNELGDASRKVVHDLNRASLNNSVNNVAGQREILATLKEQREVVEAQYQAAVNSGNSDAIKSWAETLDEIDEQINDAEESFLDTWLEALEKAKEIYEEEMEEIASDFEKGISPIYGAIDTLRDVIGRADEVESQYLSDTDKTYELSKLRRQIEGSIDDTDLVANKQALSKLQDEINKKLKDGTKISEYDLKILQSKYELELAKQALDNAQNDNSMVRLTRDNNGNYGYVYTADEDKIAEAEQNYEDKLHAYQKANEEYLEQLQDDILSVQETWQEQVAAIKLAFADGEITQAEQEARIAEINSWYQDRMEFLRQQYDNMFENSQVAAEIFKEYYQDTSAEILTTFDQTSLSIATGYNSLEAMFKGFWSTHNEYVGNANDLMDKYLTKLEDINKIAGTVTGAFSDSASGWAITITGESEEVLNDLHEISNDATESFKKVIDAAAEWESSYGKMLDSAIAKSEKLVREMQEMIAALAGLESTDFSQYQQGIDENSTATANNIASVRANTASTYSMTPTATSLPATVQSVYNNMTASLDYDSGLNDILNNLDLESIIKSIGLNVSSMLNQLTALQGAIISEPVEHIFNQNVQIDADFPNVTDSNEIVDALQTIVEEASQFANQKTV